MDTGKFQVTSKHESESQAQRIVASGQWAGVASARKQKKLEAKKCLL